MKDAGQKLRAKTSRAIDAARRDQAKNAARLSRFQSARSLKIPLCVQAWRAPIRGAGQKLCTQMTETPRLKNYLRSQLKYLESRDGTGAGQTRELANGTPPVNLPLHNREMATGGGTKVKPILSVTPPRTFYLALSHKTPRNIPRPHTLARKRVAS